MEENKNLTPETDTEVTEEVNQVEDFDIAEAVKGEKKAKKAKAPKAKKPKKLKNQALLKKGSYSMAITAAVVAGAIILNVLVSALADRFVLEFDMSANKDNSISQENIDFIKGIDSEINVTVCADDDTYSEYMGYYAQQYNVSDDSAASYYDQTVTLINKYGDYNKNIKINFIDTQSTEFAEISSKYSTQKLAYGDIIVSSGKAEEEKSKIIGFKDIYNLYEDTTYASYGMSFYTVSGNNIETALTSAISYVSSDKIKKAAIITGHSAKDYTTTYQAILKDNNYETTLISDSIVTEISDEFDVVVIPCPTVDFIGTELDALSSFLDNDGKLNKGLIFFADVSAPYLTNLYEFLGEWGIVIEDGILFETNENNHMPDDPTTIGSYVTDGDDMLSGMNTCITGYNVPMYAGFENQDSITVTPLMQTPETPVAAPKGTGADWTGAGDYKSKAYSTAMMAKKSTYDDDNKLIASYVTAFSSLHFLESEYSEYSSLSNKNLVLAVTEKLAGADDTGISFVSKYIEEESFADKVTETSANIIRLIFMILLPIACIAIGVYIYIRRRNA